MAEAEERIFESFKRDVAEREEGDGNGSARPLPSGPLDYPVKEIHGRQDTHSQYFTIIST